MWLACIRFPMHQASQFKMYYKQFAWVLIELFAFFVTDQSTNYLEFIFGFTIALIINWYPTLAGMKRLNKTREQQ